MIRPLLYRGFSLLGRPAAQSFEQASQAPAAVQLAKLLEIVSANATSRFGSDHNFALIKNIADYQNSVPVGDYEYHKPYIDRAVAGEHKVLTDATPLMFATTSGTSGSPKYIPITPGYLSEFRKASVVSGFHLYKNFPKVDKGVTLSIVSAAQEGLTPGGIPYGAISGQLFLKEPALIKKYISPIPYEVFLIKDYETRYYTILRAALMLPVTSFYTLNPSTILMLVKKLRLHGERLVRDIAEGTITPPQAIDQRCRLALSNYLHPDKVRARALSALLNQDEFVPDRIWPDLQVVACWTKAAAAFYLKDFPEFFGQVPICDITYGASEGRGTVFMGPDRQMLAIQSHFFEFIPEAEIESKNPTVLLSNEVEVGKNYYILFTTSGGLYRYHINDVVKVTGFHNQTPLIEFQYKGGNICSFTGEKITEMQVTEAMTKSLQECGADIAFFTLVPEFRPEPHYELWIEPLLGQTNLEPLIQLASYFDRYLGQVNIEYQSKRNSQRLAPIEVSLLASGSYEQLRRNLTASGIADSQIKVSHLNPKADIKKYFSERIQPVKALC